ncbi:uncharacterized protein LOC129919450 [Episyrphus balteatus]|uniref:uncharacterized protein LOC129919450 n=1 Tax=Episyrphus balteatus TaxID=286459 RepID=UPI002485FF01|nr:uncharacterized protein LOC129919450 [Episyrphus balteatus]
MTNSGHHNPPPIPDATDGAASNGAIPIDRVEWSRNTILEFIEDYRSFNVLWDPNTKGYHIKQVKYEALRQLSRKYGTEVRVIRSKIKSLRSSFHREHGKVISGKRRGVNYQPMWFAYEAIRFILDGERNGMGGGISHSSFDAVCGGIGGREHDGFVVGDVFVAAAAAAAFAAAGAADTVSNGIDTKDELVAFTDQINDPHYVNISAGDVKTEIFETPNEEIENVSRSQKSAIKKAIKSKKRQRLPKIDSTSHHLVEIPSDSESDSLASSSNPTCKKIRKTESMESSDEFGVFGEYVGITIRRLKSSKAQVVIKHLINNLLFDAEMGRYDYGIPTTREPPHLYATTD